MFHKKGNSKVLSDALHSNISMTLKSVKGT